VCVCVRACAFLLNLVCELPFKLFPESLFLNAVDAVRMSTAQSVL
jgi:hypothetical protein